MSLDWVKEEGATMTFPKMTKIIAGKYVEIPLDKINENDFLSDPVLDIPKGSSSAIGRHLASNDKSIVDNVAETDTNGDLDLFYGDEDEKNELRKSPQLENRGFEIDQPARPQVYGSSDYRDLVDVTEESVNVFDPISLDTEVQRSDMPGIIHESDTIDFFDEVDFSNIKTALLVTSDDPGYDVLKYLYSDKEAWAEYLLDMANADIMVDYDEDERVFLASPLW